MELNSKVLAWAYITMIYLAVSYLAILLFYPEQTPAVFGAVNGVIFLGTTYIMTHFFGAVVDILKNENPDDAGHRKDNKGLGTDDKLPGTDSGPIDRRIIETRQIS